MDEEKKEYYANTVFSLFGVAMLLMLVFGALGGWIGYQTGISNCKGIFNDTVIIEHWDTAFIESPPDTVTVTKTKVVKALVHDTTTKTITDSVLVELPFEQRYAKLGDFAEVWYSGFQAKIDSARAFRHTITEIIHEPISKQSINPNFIGVEAGFNDASVMYLHRTGQIGIGFSAGITYQDIMPTARAVIGFSF